MSTSTLVRPSQRLSNDGEKPTINHYMSKADITRAIVTGESVLALCGSIGPIRARGGGAVTQTTRGRMIVCRVCKSIFDGLTN